MRALTRLDADNILAPLGIKIGEWNELLEITSASEISMRALKPPTAAINLYVVSLWLTDWLPIGNWKLLQIDNSTSLSNDESLLFQQLLDSLKQGGDVTSERTFQFVVGEKGATRQRIDVLISSIIFFALMFEWHIHIVADGGAQGQRLALLDGIIYFFGDKESISIAESLEEHLKSHPLATPQKNK